MLEMSVVAGLDDMLTGAGGVSLAGGGLLILERVVADGLVTV